MPAAATTIIAPSNPLAKYSAFERPKGWSLSGGAAAMRSIHSASSAATRLTMDSSASDSIPTDPVTSQAAAFRAMVATAALTESQA